MAYEVRLALRAIRDLRHIYQHIQAEGSDAAHAWFLGLEAMVISLEKYPTRGAVTCDRPSVRHLLYGKKPHIYRILYTIDEDRKTVSMAHIRHGARRPLSGRKTA
jgi:plasmid stabilization system protein ParE